MINFDSKASYNFDDLITIIALLRSPDGCPWDREQTHASIRRNFIEEVYEVCEAIDEGNPEHLREELGDVLTQVVFHASLEADSGQFDINGVCDGICKKLILRHPHVFGNVSVSGTEDVLTNWDQIKRKEKGQRTHTSAMDSVARSLPALWRAEKIQHKAAKVGFDWPNAEGALAKLAEEIAELQQAIRIGQGAEEELGDVLFSAVNVARFIEADPEQVLSGSCDKFIRRFSFVEESARSAGKSLEQMSLEEMDKLWEQSKRQQL